MFQESHIKIRNELNDEIFVNNRRDRIHYVNQIHGPAWHLFPLNKYFDNDISWGINYGRSLPILATRGCPYKCTFCSSPNMWGTKYSMRTVDEVVSEIKYLNASFGITNFDFYDLTAIITKKWILEFCDRIISEQLQITWQIPGGTRTEALTYEVVLALKKSGCKNITYAPESGSKKILAAIKKKIDPSKMLQSMKESFNAGLNIKMNIMIGFPDEKLSDIIKTNIFLIKASFIGAEDAVPSIFNPYPGSALFDELIEKKELCISDDYFKNMVYTQSPHKFTNYNRHLGKTAMSFILFISFFVFYSSNYLFRPIRLFRLFFNSYTRNYKTRGEYMLGEIIKRRKAINRLQKSLTGKT